MRELIERLRARLDGEARLRPRYFRFGGCLVALECNEPELADALDAYFRDFAAPAGAADLRIAALETQATPLALPFLDWPRDGGKRGRKDTFADRGDCRVLRKLRTGMQFLIAPDRLVAFGPCRANLNQVINFAISQYMGWLLDRGWRLCHAAGVARDGRGLAISAASGGGKSTLALHLVSRGWDFVSNDRLLLKAEDGAVLQAGVPKQPRVNPGTLLHNPDLTALLPPARRDALGRLDTETLWRLEEKYDVPIAAVFGPGRFRLQAPLAALVLLSWRLDDAGPTRLRPVALDRRPDLLAALAKAPGPFYRARSGRFARPDDPLDHAAYARLLAGVPVYELSGRVDFEAAVQALARLSSNRHAAPAS